jgi:GT2 family glycosyltransferase/glycosyltransferase involved in cell wall biosynthesis
MRTPRTGVVSVVLVNFRGATDTIACVRALRKCAWEDDRLEIIVVENGSGDDSRERLEEIRDLASIVVSAENLGFAGGCNLGVEHATGEYVAFLNNDARPDREWIAAAVATFESSTSIGAVASKVLDWDGVDLDYGGAAITWFGMGYKPGAGDPDDGTHDDERDVLFGTGAAMFVRSEVFRALGGFDERYFMFYEDVDLGWRINLRGFRVRYQPASLAFHRHHASMAKFPEYHETYLLERNALFTLYKNLGDENLAAQLGAAAMLAIRRGVARVDRDTTSFDLRRSQSDGPTSELGNALVAAVDAVDQLVEELPSLIVSREEIQRTRVRSDGDLARLFGQTDEPAYPIERYLDGYQALMSALPVAVLQRTRVLVITGDPVGERMAGPAIRAWNMAQVLAAQAEVRLVSLTSATRVATDFDLQALADGPDAMSEHEAWADVIVVQGHALALFPVLEASAKPLVVDVYDPLHLEVLEQSRGKDLDDARAAVLDAVGVLNHQLERGDFFLCASERQRHFWLGQLAAVGRVNPQTYARDPNLDSLLAVAPFGVPVDPPQQRARALRGVVPGIGADDKVIIWAGGIYDWFDPATLIRAVGRLAERRPELRLFFMGTKHPNPLVPLPGAVAEARELARSLGLLDTHVFFNDSWVDYADRQNYLLEADAGVSTHFQHVETTFSFRTRILDYIWCGLPIVTTAGDAFADLVDRERMGRSVPEQDVEALEAALESVLYEESVSSGAREAVERVRARFTWPRVLAPLTEFVRAPRRAADRVPSAILVQDADGPSSGSPVISFVRAEPPANGLRYDVGRAVHYLRNGGIRAVVSRYVQRRRRAKQ